MEKSQHCLHLGQLLESFQLKHLENCIENEKNKSGRNQVFAIKLLVKRNTADGGYLDTQRRRRTWRPTKSFGELAASGDPKISEWGNPKVLPIESIDRSEPTQPTETS